ncbi:MAG: hypothetical protein WC346_18735 [Methanogenium sp.]|jgi:hypothetical protein
MEIFRKISKELEKKLREEKDKEKRVDLIFKELYSAYILGFSPKGEEYSRIDEKYPIRIIEGTRKNR